MSPAERDDAPDAPTSGAVPEGAAPLHSKLDRAALRGAQCFEAGQYFEAHEAWEAAWITLDRGSEEAQLLQGLIQAGAALHKLRAGSLRGAHSLARSARERLALAIASSGSKYRGVELERILRTLELSMDYAIDPELTRAATLPGRFYSDANAYELLRERVFAKSWQYAGDRHALEAAGTLVPMTLLPGLLDEPLLLARGQDGEQRLLSNVCTHRGSVLVDAACTRKNIACRYHGRRFSLDGKFESAPGFEGAQDFPSKSDDLRHVPHAALGPWLFASIDPAEPFEKWIAPLLARVGWLPLDQFRFDAARSRDWLIKAHWALYCENYLEGFHIPFVHAGLNAVIEHESYQTLVEENCVLQIARAKPGELAFDLPAGHPDSGTRVAAWYAWLWPNLMLNFYPWGVSMNLVEPQGLERTRVRFLTFVWRADLCDRGAGAGLEQVELEDEAVVEAVQRGVRSRSYTRGRYSPVHERGVHHFHRRIARALVGS